MKLSHVLAILAAVGCMTFALGWCAKPVPVPPPANTPETVYVSETVTEIDTSAEAEIDSLLEVIRKMKPPPAQAGGGASGGVIIEPGVETTVHEFEIAIRDAKIRELATPWKQEFRLSASDPSGVRVEAMAALSVDPMRKHASLTAKLDTVQCPPRPPEIVVEGFSLTQVALVGALSALIGIAAGLTL